MKRADVQLQRTRTWRYVLSLLLPIVLLSSQFPLPQSTASQRLSTGSRNIPASQAAALDPTPAPATLPVATTAIPAPSAYDAAHNGVPSATWTRFAGHGVNVVLGNFVAQSTDLQVTGRGLPFAFVRTYSSANVADGPLGYGWTHSYNLTLTVESGTSVLIRAADGRLDRYTLSGGGYTPPPGVFNTLTAQSDGTFLLKQPDQTRYRFDAAGRLTAIADRNDNTLTLSYTAGRLTQIADTVGRIFTLSYDSAGHITQLADPSTPPRTIAFAYNAAGDLITTTDARANTTTFAYDSTHRLTTITDPRPQLVLTNTYNAAGRVTQQQDAAGKIVTFAYDYSVGQTRFENERQQPTIFSFDSQYRATGEQDARGHVAVFSYDTRNHLAGVTDKRGYRWSFTYDAAGNPLTSVDPLGGTTTRTYDTRNNPLTSTDARGNVTTMSYDTRGNLTAVVDARNQTTTLSYDSAGQLQLITDAEGRTTDPTYDAQGNLTGITNALNQITRLTPDTVGRITGVTDARSHSYSLTYDAADQPLELIDPKTGRTTFTYDAVGNRLASTDANTHTTQYAYDGRNLLTSVTDPAGKRTQYTYTGTGKIATTTDANNATTTSTYDERDWLVSVQAPDGGTTRYEYDPNHNLIKVTDAGNHVTQYRYDALNRMIAATTPVGTTRYEYDAVGNRTAVIDANGYGTRSSYGALNQLEQVTDARGKVVRYQYDKVGNQTAVIDANGHATRYTYDALNRVTAIADGLNHTTRYTYDATGNRTQTTDPNNNVTQYRYDELNRVSAIVYPDQTIGFTYDAVGNRATMVDRSGTTNYTYDDLNRLTAITNGASQTLRYSYDAVGNRTGLTYPSGKTVTYTYDSMRRMRSVADGAATTQYTYDQPGNRTGVSFPNGVATSYRYDEASRLEAIRTTSPISGTLLHVDYVLDSVGNRVQMVDNDGLTDYRYDPLYRLTGVTYPDGVDVSYSYDDAGNRTAMRGPEGTTAYSYDAADRLTSMTGGGTTTAFSYDNNGNMTAKGATQYTYDSANRLTKVISGTTTVEYSYDGEGYRTSRAVNGTVHKYAWDTQTALPEMVAETIGTEQTEYVYGGDLLAQTDPGQHDYYYHADGLGSIRALSAADGTSVNRYTYDAFGQPHAQEGVLRNPYQFTGQQVDAETGLVYLRARYYDPSIGRFLSRDLVLTEPPYAYSSNNPVSRVDPSGTYSIGCSQTQSYVEYSQKQADNTAWYLEKGAVVSRQIGPQFVGERAEELSKAIHSSAAKIGQFTKRIGNIFGAYSIYQFYTGQITVREAANSALSSLTRTPILGDCLAEEISNFFPDEYLKRDLDAHPCELTPEPDCPGIGKSTPPEKTPNDDRPVEKDVTKKVDASGNTAGPQQPGAKNKGKQPTLPGPVTSKGNSPRRPSQTGPGDWSVERSGGQMQLCAQHNGSPDNGVSITHYEFKAGGAGQPGYWLSGAVASSCATTSGLAVGTYSWRVRVRDQRGLWSDWSDERHFTIMSTELTLDELRFSGSSNSDLVRVYTTVRTGPLGNNLKMFVNTATNGSGDGDWVQIDTQGRIEMDPNDVNTWARWDTPDFADGTHLVRAIGYRGTVEQGTYIEAVREATFTLTRRRPSFFSQIVPGFDRDDSPPVRQWFNTRTVNFTWEPTLAQRITFFKLFVSANANPEVNPIVTRTFNDPNQRSFSYTFDDDYPQLSWSIAACNEIGCGRAGVGYLGVDRQVPTATVTALPATTYELNFPVKWSGTDNAAGIISYDVQVKDGATGEWRFWKVNQTDTTATFAGEDGHTYFFRVRARDRAGNESALTGSNGDTSIRVDSSTRPVEPWWNTAYSVKRNLLIVNRDSGHTLPTGYPVLLRFDATTTPSAAAIYSASQSATKGHDIRIVYNNQTELSRFIPIFRADRIEIWFKLQAPLTSLTSDGTSYQLYSGNSAATNPPGDVADVMPPAKDSSTIALWHLHEGQGGTATDSVSGRVATALSNGGGSFGWEEQGFVGAAVTLSGQPQDGNGVWLEADGSGLSPAQISVEAWIRETSQGVERTIVSRRSNGGSGWQLYLQDGKVAFEVNSQRTDGGPNLTLGVWYHVAGTYDGATLRVYLNGQKVGEKTVNTSVPTGTGALRIGKHADTSNYFNGAIQHVRISNVARTSFSEAGFTLIAPTPETSAGDAVTKPDMTPIPTPTATRTPTATNTPHPSDPTLRMFGNGRDGDLTVAAGQTVAIDTVRAALTSSAPAGLRGLTVATTVGFAATQEILIIQMQGAGAGQYEFGTIERIDGNTLILAQNLTFSYTVSGASTSQVLKVPHYRNVTVQSGGTLTASAWDGSTGGIVAFRSAQQLHVEQTATINVTGKGFRGPGAQTTGREERVSRPGEQGEGISGPLGTRSTAANGNGGGGGGYDTNIPWSGGRGGAGGGNGTTGAGGMGSGGGNTAGGNSVGGSVGGNSDLTIFTFGGGGGQGGVGDVYDNVSDYASGGGAGGGGVIVFSQSITLAGTLRANGDQGGDNFNPSGYSFTSAGGGGAGGSVLLTGRTVSLGTGHVTALGGRGGYTNYPASPGGDRSGGDGGVGRVRVEYCDTWTGTSTPATSAARLNCEVPTPTPTRTPTATTVPPTATPTATPTMPPASVLFATSFEDGDMQPTWSDTVDWSQNVTGYCCDLTQMESSIRGERGHTGASALMYSGADTSATTSYSYNKVFDVHIPVTADTTLSYWLYPEQSNGTYVAIDFLFTDGTSLRDSDAVDQWGTRLHPTFQGQGGHLPIQVWTEVRSPIGAKVAGRTIDRILIAYDQPANIGQFRGFLDDLRLTKGNSVTPTATPVPPTPTPTPTPTPPPSTALFATSFEDGDMQPTWSDTVDWSQNVTGYCCGLTQMESSIRGERGHTGASALMYSGADTSATASYSYNKVFDVHIPVTADTTLSYWLYPEQSNGTYVAIDMLFTDGTSLRDSDAVDQWGTRLHPTFQGQGGHLPIQVWTEVRSPIGAKVAGRTIDRILIAYDQPANIGQFRGFLDDLRITSGTSSSPTPTPTNTPSPSQP